VSIKIVRGRVATKKRLGVRVAQGVTGVLESRVSMNRTRGKLYAGVRVL